MKRGGALLTRPLPNKKSRLPGPMVLYQQPRNYSRRPTYMKPEQKNVDHKSTVQLAPNLGTSGTWSNPLCLNLIGVGAGPANSRIGRKISMTSFLLRIATFQAIDSPLQVRVLVVYDNNSNGFTPTAADILNDPTSSESPMDLTQSERFKVIVDTVLNLQGADGGAPSNIMINDPIFRKLRNLEQHFLGSGLSTSDIGKGAMWILFTSNGLNSSTPQLNIYSRIRYTDV